MKAALVAGVHLRQQQVHLLHPFAEPRDRLVWQDAEAAEFVRQKSAGEADIETAAADRIEHRDLAGKLQRVIECRQDSAGDKPRPARALRRRGEKHDRVRTAAAVMVEVVLDDADMAETQPVGLLRQVERFPEIDFGRSLSGRTSGKNCTPNRIRGA